MSLKTFVIPVLFAASTLPSLAQTSLAQKKIKHTGELDLFTLFCSVMESGELPPTDYASVMLDSVDCNCKSYDFTLIPDSSVVSLHYCPMSLNKHMTSDDSEVKIEYPESNNEKERE